MKDLRRRLAGPVTVGEILDVAAGFEQSGQVDAQIAKIYDWHHTRGLTGLQLAFAPAAVAVATLVAQGATTWVFVVAGALLLLSVVVGLWRLGRVNCLHTEYLLALRLGSALLPFHAELASYLQSQWFGEAAMVAADPNRGAVGAGLYRDLAEITMLRYRSESEAQEAVSEALKRARVAQ